MEVASYVIDYADPRAVLPQLSFSLERGVKSLASCSCKGRNCRDRRALSWAFSASHCRLPNLWGLMVLLGFWARLGCAGPAHLHRDLDTAGARIARTDWRQTAATGD